MVAYPLHNRIAKDQNLTSAAKCVHAFLAWKRTSNPKAISYRGIGTALAMPERTAIRAILLLERCGYLCVSRRTTHPNEYRVSLNPSE